MKKILAQAKKEFRLFRRDRLLIMLAALAAFWLHATLMQAKPAWIGLIVLGFESVVLLCLKIHEARRARRQQERRGRDQAAQPTGEQHPSHRDLLHRPLY